MSRIVDFICDKWPTMLGLASVIMVPAFIVILIVSMESRNSEEARLQECEAILTCIRAGATREQCDAMHPECAP